MDKIAHYYETHNLWIEKIIDFYQHDIEITYNHVSEMFAKCKMTDDKLIDLIQTVDLRSYKNCPEYIKIIQNNYIRNMMNE